MGSRLGPDRVAIDARFLWIAAPVVLAVVALVIDLVPSS